MCAQFLERIGYDATLFMSSLDPQQQGYVLWEAVRSHFCPNDDDVALSFMKAGSD